MPATTAPPATAPPTTARPIPWSPSPGDLMGIDRVVDLEPGRGATCVKLVPATLDIFDSHFPRFPVLPGVVILGAMAATAALALGGTGGTDPDDWVIDSARRVRFRHFVRPGDTIELSVQLDPGQLDPGQLDPGQLDPGQLDEVTCGRAVARATARVEGAVVTSVGRLVMVTRTGGERS